MRVPVVAPSVLLAGVGLGAVMTVVTLLPGPVGLTATIGVLCAGVFLLWPRGGTAGRHRRRHPAQRR
ncbi:hypothetical protein AB0C50_22580 [Micromonospora taraxaci]|uniref:Uncharacterized protein n=1 Tax=Micromonospora taraxaci TaxID=1316803 RepID=A0A561W1I3_9ACTN|nr:hypothetical protein [Micromonospora taraxaci]TWG17726.1 hypothetical protein FHU34_113068 [Micromonospora taraxaci]